MKHNLKVKLNKDILKIINYFLDELKYESVMIYRGEPDDYVPSHYHVEEQFIYVIEGEMEGDINGEHIKLSEGDEYNFPPNVIHDAKMSRVGCKYLVAAKNGNYEKFLKKPD